MIVAAACGLLTGCLGRRPRPPFVVDVRVESDPGRPVAGAALIDHGEPVAVTDSSGVARLQLRGDDGSARPIHVACPKDFESPAQPVAIRLHRFVEASKRPEYHVACRPTVRTIVVAVRADGAADLPVRYLGQEVARTDSSGAAHVVLKVPPQEPLSLEIGTDEPGGERLRPQNPVQTFLVKNQDEMFVFDQTFQLAKAKVTHGGRAPHKLIRIVHKS